MIIKLVDILSIIFLLHIKSWSRQDVDVPEEDDLNSRAAWRELFHN